MIKLFKKKVHTPISLGVRDIHNHILPGVDDGFRLEEDSLEAVRRLSELGVKEIVFTPHINPEIFRDSNEDNVRKVYDRFRSLIPESMGVKTHLAAEYMIIKDFEKRAQDSSLLLYEDGESILVEMSYYYRSQNLEATIFNLLMAGKRPILAHPERYLYMADCLEDFDRLSESGCRFQMNYMSLSGIYGKESLKILRYLKERGLYSFEATDLHTLPQLDSILGINL